jgi:tryptophanyl-tRNA synthetase
MKKKTLVSGVKPTGRPHLGNYFGAMRQFVDLQNEYEAFVFVADLHALNSIQNKEEMQNLSRELVLDYLAIGLDPEKVTFFKQSSISAHAELTWIFDTLVTVPFMMRSHAYKDAVAKEIEPGMGLFNYPVLMAADILLYSPDIVPVGKDQKQHIEYTRDIAQKFNNTYGETFKLPKELIIEDVETVPGVDGQKMSKSYGNTIPLFGTDAEIKKAIMGIVTDSKEPEDKKNPDEVIVYQLYKLVAPEQKVVEMKEGLEKGGLGYGAAKKMLLEAVLEMIAPMRERRAEFEAKPELVDEILRKGTEKAREVAEAKMNEVKQNVGLL